MTASSTVVAALTARRWTLGVAESLTGGALTAEIVAVPGASSTLLGGVVAYATPVKHSLLGVDHELLARHGPVHAEVALQMASGVRRAVQVHGRDADVGVSTTGIAGPDSSDGQPVGTVHIAVVTPEAQSAEFFEFSGDRPQIRALTVDAALALLLRTVGE